MRNYKSFLIHIFQLFTAGIFLGIIFFDRKFQGPFLGVPIYKNLSLFPNNLSGTIYLFLSNSHFTSSTFILFSFFYSLYFYFFHLNLISSIHLSLYFFIFTLFTLTLIGTLCPYNLFDNKAIGGLVSFFLFNLFSD